MLRFVSSIVDTGIWPLLICFWGEALTQQVSASYTDISCNHHLMKSSVTTLSGSTKQSLILEANSSRSGYKMLPIFNPYHQQ
jgi:hypothetical protein